jgi:hypothetical protein
MSIWDDPQADPFKTNGAGYSNGHDRQTNGANGADNATHTAHYEDDAEQPIVCEALEPIPITSIPPRPWAYGNFLLFGCASALAAVDGGGKGATAVTIALSMITGQELLREKVWRTGPVVILTYEDDKTEWQRRIAAACLHYDLDYQSVCRSIYFISRPRGRVALAAHSAINGRTVMFPDHAAIVAHLQRIKPVLFIIDPFNHAHALEDGNSNAMIAQLAAEISRIAAESMIAVLVLHHLRKGATGHIDDMMGAVMLRATFRATRLLMRMTKEEAEKLEIPIAEAWRYNRIASGKENYSPPPDLNTWYAFKSVRLGNGTELYPDGDNVQVVDVWVPPSPFKGLPKSHVAEIFDQLRTGLDEGEFYAAHSNAGNRWAGVLISEVTGRNAQEARGILRDWIKNRVVLENEYRSPKNRKQVSRLVVNEVKAAEVLGSLYQPPEAGE